MNKDDLENFGKLINATFAIYGKDAPDEVIDIYFNVLSKYDFFQVRNAFSKYIANPDTGTFFPKPSDIVKILDGNSHKKSFMAWIKVLNTVTEHGTYKTIIFDDEIIHAVVKDMGGWEKFCFSINDSSREKIEKDFCRRYEYYLEDGVKNYPKFLIGYFQNKSPIFVGEEEKALLVYENGYSSNNFIKNKSSLIFDIKG